MTIGRKLIVGYGLVLALMLITTLVAIFSLNGLRTTYDSFIDVNERLADSADAVGLSIRDQVVHFRGAILYPAFRDESVDELEQARARFNNIVADMRGLASRDEELAFIDELVAGAAALNEVQDRALERLSVGVSVDEVTSAGDFLAADLSDTLLESASAFREQQAARVVAGRARVAAGTRWVINLMIGTSIAAILLGFGIATYLGRSITGQLNDGIMRLTSAAAQILSTCSQVASGTAQTATAVNETTATVEEVKQTAQVASQKAKQVSESAQRMSAVAQTGRASIDDTIEVMDNIQVQMESVGDSIVQLAERSQAIGEIIATVNDLAEQSNLLAVNAAIEATRAGEHGKGFTVVAQEVRSLASQSKQATAQVRSILGEVQKATHAAVLATEQGNKAVDQGVGQTKSTSEAINQLADSVVSAAQAATQIAASNQQQMVGMDQVALAMDNIKEASSQNAAGTRQAEAAAQDLQELGRNLRRLISRVPA